MFIRALSADQQRVVDDTVDSQRIDEALVKVREIRITVRRLVGHNTPGPIEVAQALTEYGFSLNEATTLIQKAQQAHRRGEALLAQKQYERNFEEDVWTYLTSQVEDDQLAHG